MAASSRATSPRRTASCRSPRSRPGRGSTEVGCPCCDVLSGRLIPAGAAGVALTEAEMKSSWRLALGATAMAACGPSEAAGPVVLRGGRLPGGEVADITFVDGKIAAIGGEMPADANVIDVSGRFYAPGFIDSHVHMAYLPDAP